MTHRLEKQEIKDIPDYKTLLVWAKQKRVTLGEVISTDKAKFDILQLLVQVYQEVKATKLKDIPFIDLIIYRIQLKEGTKVYNTKYQKLSQDCKQWYVILLRKIWIQECMREQ